MMQKTKNIILNNSKYFTDIRYIGLIIFIILLLIVSWNIVGAIQTNYELQKKISKLEQQNSVTELENQNLKLKNEYLNSDEFLELSARRQFGKAAPGEKVIVVSKETALSKITKNASESASNTNKKPTKPWYQQNFEAWADWFLHRQPADN